LPGETQSTAPEPDLSLVMPCFNEEEGVAATIGELLDAFERAGARLEIVAVDNGSRDRTGGILREFAARDPRVVAVRVEVNQGYGFGILQGFPHCTAPWVGLICADGQVEAADVVKLFAAARTAGAPALLKVRRRFRRDGLKRKLVSIAYNLGTSLLFGGLGSIDVNGNPKIFPRELLPALDLRSRDWFLDAEIMIKAKRLGLRVQEVNVFGQLRRGGTSHVRLGTCFEFARNLLACRFGGDPRAKPLAAPPVRQGAHRRRTTCRLCGSGGLELFLELGPQPLANAYPRSEAEFAGEPSFPLGVALCRDCSLVQTPDVIDPETLFRDYVYRTGASPAMSAHFREFAKEVVASQRLGRDDLVVEIASNDGTLLRHFKELGVRTLGIEPARNLAAESRAAGIETRDVFFDAAAAGRIRRSHGPASAVLANNVLAHVDDPVGFLAGARALLASDGGGGAEGRLWVEVPWLLELEARLEYDTIYHEHLSCFGAATLARACEAAGLEVVSVERAAVHGGSLRLCARPAAPGARAGRPADATLAARLDEERAAGLLRIETWRRFAGRVEGHRARLVELLRGLRSAGRSIAAYGAPAKGSTLLNWCRIGPDLVDFTVDRNPGKVGRYTPGVHLPILPVDALLARQPDFVLLLAWNLADEIMAQQAEYARRGGRFILPVPEPRIVVPAASGAAT